MKVYTACDCCPLKRLSTIFAESIAEPLFLDNASLLRLRKYAGLFSVGKTPAQARDLLVKALWTCVMDGDFMPPLIPLPIEEVRSCCFIESLSLTKGALCMAYRLSLQVVAFEQAQKIRMLLHCWSSKRSIVVSLVHEATKCVF